MMKNSIIIGDLHLKLETKEYLDILYNQIIQAIKKIKSNNKSPIKINLIFLGDIYDGKAIIRSEIQNYFVNFLEQNILNSSYFDKIIILVGNHDLENLQKSQNSLQVIKKISDKILVIDEPYLDQDCLYVPYIHDNSKFLDILNKNKNAKYIFAHQAINGFKYREGKVCEDGVSKEEIKNKATIISGHFHCPQQKKDNILYVGGAWSQTFNEANEQKRFIIISDDDQIEEQRIKNIPKHLIFNIEFNKKQNNIIPWDKINEKDKVRLIISGKKEEIKSMPDIQTNLEKDIELQVHLNFTDEKIDIKIKENLTPNDMFCQYVDQNKDQYEDICLLKKKGEEYLKNYAEI